MPDTPIPLDLDLQPREEEDNPYNLVKSTAFLDDPALKKGGGPFARKDWDAVAAPAIKSTKPDKGWYAKSGAAQARILQRMMGTYRPHASDPILLSTSRNGVRSPGSLKDHHESEKVRRCGTEADAIVNANPATQPPLKPAPAPEPVVGYCWGCHKALPRYGIRADTKFCQDNDGKCRRKYRNREANRAILDAAFKKDDRAKKADTTAGIPGFPGLELPFYYPAPPPAPTIAMNAMYAARNHRVAEFLAVRKKTLLQDNLHNDQTNQ